MDTILTEPLRGNSGPVLNNEPDVLDLEIIIPVICLVLIILVVICWRLERSNLEKEYKFGQELDRASFGLVREVTRIKDGKVFALKSC